MSKEYKCAVCGETFREGWSDEEARQEAAELFGKPVDQWKDEAVIVCDDCFQQMHPALHSVETADTKKYL